MSREFLEVIRSRRVVRNFTDTPIAERVLAQILEMARWAPAASNRRHNRYICLTDKDNIRRIQMVSPGMVAGFPTALIIVCVDWESAGHDAMNSNYQTTYIDIGTAVENMLLAAHALGLGAWPMTSFSPDAIRILLNIPGHLSPTMFVGLGHPSRSPRPTTNKPKKRVRMEEIVQWGAFPHKEDSK